MGWTVTFYLLKAAVWFTTILYLMTIFDPQYSVYAVLGVMNIVLGFAFEKFIYAPFKGRTDWRVWLIRFQTQILYVITKVQPMRTIMFSIKVENADAWQEYMSNRFASDKRAIAELIIALLLYFLLGFLGLLIVFAYNTYVDYVNHKKAELAQ